MSPPSYNPARVSGVVHADLQRKYDEISDIVAEQAFQITKLKRMLVNVEAEVNRLRVLAIYHKNKHVGRGTYGT